MGRFYRDLIFNFVNIFKYKVPNSQESLDKRSQFKMSNPNYSICIEKYNFDDIKNQED